jgi:hypothetical protein
MLSCCRILSGNLICERVKQCVSQKSISIANSLCTLYTHDTYTCGFSPTKFLLGKRRAPANSVNSSKIARLRVGTMRHHSLLSKSCVLGRIQHNQTISDRSHLTSPRSISMHLDLSSFTLLQMQLQHSRSHVMRTTDN